MRFVSTGSLTELNVQFNNLGDDGKEVLKDAVCFRLFV